MSNEFADQDEIVKPALEFKNDLKEDYNDPDDEQTKNLLNVPSVDNSNFDKSSITQGRISSSFGTKTKLNDRVLDIEIFDKPYE